MPSSDPAAASAYRSCDTSSDSRAAFSRASWRITTPRSSAASVPRASVFRPERRACARQGASADATSRETTTTSG